MALSNAEKRWRRRQKEKNAEVYMCKERDRKKLSYVPHHLLSQEKLTEQRMKDRVKAKRKYQRQKQREANNGDSPPTTSRVTRSSERSSLTVKMPFKAKKTAVKKRYQTAAYRQIEALTSKNNELEKMAKRERKRAQKQRERMRHKTASLDSNNNNTLEERNTPRSKTKVLLKKAGLKLRPRSQVFKQLVFGQTIAESLKNSLRKYKTKQSKAQVLALDVIRKYRCIKSLSTSLGVERKKIRGICAQRVSKTMREKYGHTVINFLEREDNITVLPGKRDTKTVGKVVHQKRVLSDYLHNIYGKFTAEYPEAKISDTVLQITAATYFANVLFLPKNMSLYIPSELLTQTENHSHRRYHIQCKSRRIPKGIP